MGTPRPGHVLVTVTLHLLIAQHTQGKLVNVAVNKTATQSSTFNGTDTYQTPPLSYIASAGLAVDGASTKNYADKTCAVTYWRDGAACTQNPWWQVDLGCLYVIHRVDIYFRDLSVPSAVTVRVGSQAVQAPQGSVQGSVHLKSVILSAPVTASTVNISLSGCAILQLCEVEVLTDDSELVNVALHKPATQSSTFNGTDSYERPPLTYTASAGLAVDGASTKNYADKTCAVTYWRDGAACTQNPWWQVDLGCLYVIHRVDIYFRNLNVPSAVTVRVGSQEVQAQQGSVQGSVHLKSVSLSTPVTASTVNISLSDCAILQLCEVEVLTDDSNNVCNSNPCQYGGTCQDGGNSYTCGCVPGYTGINCQTDINDCSSNPCQNGGTCIDGVNTYTCNCVRGYTGNNCETNIDDCRPNPCQHGGTCSDGVDSYTCRCDPRFLGPNCQETNECFSNPCQHGGTCRDGVNSYTCSCVPGFTGTNCQTNIDDCESNPCQHGATCVDGVNSYNCTCARGFTGTDCEMNFNECASSPCQNGSCVDGIDSYTCNCTAGFTGNLCETDIDDCASSPCINGGACRDMVNAFSCACPAGFNGTTCEENIDDCAIQPCDNGTCTDGVNNFTCACKAGYRGFTCDTTCSGGHFGQDCGEACSPHCLDAQPGTAQHCHYVTGLCLRAEGCKDGYQGSSCTELPGPNIGAIAGGIIAAVVVIVVIAAVVWFRRRNTRPELDMDGPEEKPGKTKRQQPQANLDQVEDGPECHEMAGDDRDVYYNTAADVSSTRLTPNRLPALLASTRADPDFLKKEYQRLPQGLTHPVTVATNEHNKGKNRYKGICAYDHSRVVLSRLPGKPHSDYVNACYVHGYKKPQAFIASQGPTDVNVVDFLRMIWEKDIEKIAMVTMPFESGKMKCVQYWDDSAAKVFGNFTVRVDSVSCKREEAVRVLSIQPSDGATKRVTHFLFTAWPDKDVPDSPWPLIDYRDKVMTSSSKGKAPILVHCSAGIGRTGTLIAMDVMLRQLAAEGAVDIYNTVWSLRQHRVDMVQTLSQYTFLHEAALVGLCSAGRVVPLDSLTSDPVAKSKSKIAKEYEALKRCVPSLAAEDCSLGSVPENRHANRHQDILPPDRCIVWLHVSVGSEIDYFNAVFLPNYEAERRYILTQTPLPATVVNFWRAVLEYDVTAIVTLDRLKPDSQAAVGAYVPLDQTPLQHGPLTLTLVHTDKRQGFTCRTLQVKLGDQVKTVQQWVASMWPDNTTLPPNTQHLVSMARDVCASASPGTGKILVHCRDGSRRSGLYVALSTLLERSSSEAEVAVPYVVGVLASVRPQALPSQEQYAFLYAAMVKHAGTNQVYENVSSILSSQHNYHQQENIYSNDL